MLSRTETGLALAVALIAPGAFAQAPDADWQACTAIKNNEQARLACFDAWAAHQQQPVPPATPPAVPQAPAPAPAPAPANVAAEQLPEEPTGCHDADATELSRFWELEPRTSCGTFGLRGYRPTVMSVVVANTVNKQPTSENPANNATTSQPYRTTETKIQLSIRSKLGEGMLRKGDLQDSLWFGYTQQSYWQVFTGQISRPFRNTDHEPEVFYVYPFDERFGQSEWHFRYGGLGLVHQSNGESLPLSRSWNRVYVMAGAENEHHFTLQGRLWYRFPENPATDDNPDIVDYVGRGELMAGWDTDNRQRWFFTWRTTFKQWDRGSGRLEWLVPLRSPRTGTRFGSLYLHTELFTGYGDSLIDYNKARTVFSVGLSLYDW